ncbi:MAG: adenylate kinase [Thermomicrobiales bacterium]|jgi:adenylate kinase|nr:adenylate kinase [Thermomicrobiales bacterium]MEA2525514.1 adenylate kinase [Thermomicrobiales bacterium]
MHVILMGPQGAGKGTQADQVGPRLGLAKLSTGDLFRAAIAAESDLGREIKGPYDRGELIPDDLTLGIVEERLEELDEEPDIRGALFDGFPRTRAQAEGLDTVLAKRGEGVDSVVEISVPRDVLIERLAGRRVCSNCGATYHMIFNPPKVDSICDRCGTPLIQRDDDTPEAIGRRLALYDQLTAPLIEFYEQRGLLKRVSGEQSIDDVTEDVLAAIQQTAARQ